MFEELLDEISTTTKFGTYFVSLRYLEQQTKHPKNYYSKAAMGKKLEWLQRSGIIFILNGASILNGFLPELAKKDPSKYTDDERTLVNSLMLYDEDANLKRTVFVNLTFLGIDMMKYKSTKFRSVISSTIKSDLTSLISKSMNYRGKTPQISWFLKGRGRKLQLFARTGQNLLATLYNMFESTEYSKVFFNQKFEILVFDIETIFKEKKKEDTRIHSSYKYVSDNYRSLKLVEEDYYVTLPNIIKKINSWFKEQEEQGKTPEFSFEFRKSHYIPSNNLMILTTPFDCFVHTEYYSQFWRPEQRPQTHLFKPQGLTTNSSLIESFQMHFDQAWQKAIPYSPPK